MAGLEVCRGHALASTAELPYRVMHVYTISIASGAITLLWLELQNNRPARKEAMVTCRE